MVDVKQERVRSEAERAAAAALEREEVLEPLFGDEQEPIEGLGGEDLFGGPLDGIADVPISAEMFGGGGGGGSELGMGEMGMGEMGVGGSGSGSPRRVEFSPPGQPLGD
jgi:hypothetical protein